MLTQIAEQTRTALDDLFALAKLKPNDIFVLGGSSSEILGEKIGSHSSMEAAAAVMDVLLPYVREKGVFLAVQCCEHLNRALIIEEACAQYYGLEAVNVVPQPKAGGAFATTAYSRFEKPVAVEHLRAHAGMDIGQTLIGMHMREVCVPVRCSVKSIGAATLTACRCRPKCIGGERAHYDPELK